MKLLVTGGAGFIGSNFVRRISQNIYPEISKVTVVDKLTYAGRKINLQSVEKSPNLIFIHGDICDEQLMRTLLSENDAIINFAAESHVDKSIKSPKDFIDTNINGVFNILEAIRRNNRNLRFVQVSTDEVYGSIVENSFTELDLCKPSSPYSASKACADLLTLSYHETYSINASITRSSNNYGPFQFPEKLIPLAITNILQNKKIPIYGLGTNVRDWIHVDDNCDAIYKVLLNGRKGEIYNIGGNNELSNLELVSLILKELNLNDNQIEFVSDRQGHDFRYSINFEKLNKEIGHLNKRDFVIGLKETIKWYEENPWWWKPLIQK